MKHSLLLPVSGVLCLFLTVPTARAGYSHYFTWHKKPDQARLKECVEQMRKVVNAARWTLAGADGEGDPIAEPSRVELNGRGEEAHEPFCFPGGMAYNFCKTQGKPYDAVVTACLLVARDHFPADVLEISSDGSWSEGDWDAGKALYKQVFGKSAGNPMGPDNEVGGQGLPSFMVLLVVVGIIGLVAWQWNRTGRY
jgi:hypothetical protein